MVLGAGNFETSIGLPPTTPSGRNLKLCGSQFRSVERNRSGDVTRTLVIRSDGHIVSNMEFCSRGKPAELEINAIALSIARVGEDERTRSQIEERDIAAKQKGRPGHCHDRDVLHYRPAVQIRCKSDGYKAAPSQIHCAGSPRGEFRLAHPDDRGILGQIQFQGIRRQIGVKNQFSGLAIVTSHYPIAFAFRRLRQYMNALCKNVGSIQRGLYRSMVSGSQLAKRYRGSIPEQLGPLVKLNRHLLLAEYIQREPIEYRIDVPNSPA